MSKLLLYEKIGFICPRKNWLFGLLECRKLIGIMEEEMHAPKKIKGNIWSPFLQERKVQVISGFMLQYEAYGSTEDIRLELLIWFRTNI